MRCTRHWSWAKDAAIGAPFGHRPRLGLLARQMRASPPRRLHACSCARLRDELGRQAQLQYPPRRLLMRSRHRMEVLTLLAPLRQQRDRSKKCLSRQIRSNATHCKSSPLEVNDRRPPWKSAWQRKTTNCVGSYPPLTLSILIATSLRRPLHTPSCAVHLCLPKLYPVVQRYMGNHAFVCSHSSGALCCASALFFLWIFTLLVNSHSAAGDAVVGRSWVSSFCRSRR